MLIGKKLAGMMAAGKDKAAAEAGAGDTSDPSKMTTAQTSADITKKLQEMKKQEAN